MTSETYEEYDKSKESLPLDSPYFPAYFRLLKWKLLDICVESAKNDGIGYFSLFKDCFPEGQLEEIVSKILGKAPPYTEDPSYIKLMNDDEVDEKAKAQAETYLKMKEKIATKVQRRRYSECFLKTVLFSPDGIRIADKIMFSNAHQLYQTSHWHLLPEDWMSTKTFMKRFYDRKELGLPEEEEEEESEEEDENEEKDENEEGVEKKKELKKKKELEKKEEHEIDETKKYEMQRLDRVAGSARGILILARLQKDHRCEDEYKVLKQEIGDPANLCHNEIVKEMLDEGPLYEVRVEDGVEHIYAAEKWNCHKTLMIFFYLTGFAAKSEEAQQEWYYSLLAAMKNDPTNRAALYFLNKNYAEELYEREQERDRLELSELQQNNRSETAVGETIYKEIRAQIPSGKDDNSIAPETTTELILRNYQEELVQPALEGKNCVIVAPTGSGKTEVAIYAALHHIQERASNRKHSRVVLLVPKIPLVNQQKERFLKYCGGQYIVNGIHGSESSSTSDGRRDDVLSSHVVVMTPQILINMLESVRESERLYVSDFSMMIFDEVHKTTGEHPYVIINRLVQEWQHDKPQIIGLTASLNVSATAQLDASQMLGNIYEMLALLNAPYVSTITNEDCINTLNTHISQPDDETEVCKDEKESQLRGNIETYLVEKHPILRTELEKLSKKRYCHFSTSFLKTFTPAIIKNYSYYESIITNISQELNKVNSSEKLFTTTLLKYIKVYLEARAIVDVMPAKVAFDFLEEKLRELQRDRESDETFTRFFRNHAALKNLVEEDEPLIVKRLKQILIDQFTRIPESRAIIFVTQRSTAQRVSDFLNNSSIMEEVIPPSERGNNEELVGYVLGTNKSGSTQQSTKEQQDVLDKFNNGHLRVIVATSVVEEGLDVAACNLIIKYNCSSGSVIQLVQQRGRGRSKNSRSILLTVYSKINESENNALISEKFMRQCVKQIVKNGPAHLITEVDKAKEMIRAKRLRDETDRQAKRSNFEHAMYKLTCQGCSAPFCKSTDIKKVYSNYMVFDPRIWGSLRVQSRKRSKWVSTDTQPLSDIICMQCNNTVGKAYKMRGVYLPQLDIGQIQLVSEDVGDDRPSRKKWTAVEEEKFFIPQAAQSDFELMLNALTNTTANMDKKRILDWDSKQYVKDLEMNRVRDDDFHKKKEEQPKPNPEEHGVTIEE